MPDPTSPPEISTDASARTATPASMPALTRQMPKRRRQLPLYFWAATSLVLLLIYNLIFSPTFFQVGMADGHLVGNGINVLHYGSKVMLISLGMTLVIALGGIDLSVGAIMAMAGGVAALLICKTNVTTGAEHVPAPVWVAILAGLGIGLAAGLWNGALVGYLNIQPIVVTLILMISGRGLAIYMTNGQAPTIADDSPFLLINRGSVFAVPLPILITAGAALVTMVLVRWTALGMFIESIGNNSATCEVSGLNTRLVKVMAYGFLGFCCAAAGLVDAAMNKIGDTNQSGLDIELDAIVAVAIGGTSLVGGRFCLIGSLLGAIAMQTLTVTITRSGINPQYNYVVKAFVVILICLLQSPKVRGALTKFRKAA